MKAPLFSHVCLAFLSLLACSYYTKKNMGWEYTQEEYDTWQLAERGGEQGDYRDGMPEKIANVIDCLKTEPLSKRAIIPIPFATEPSATVDWTNQGQTKCCRELHFYLEDGKLKCTGIVRMQNANIFVKNIHFFATLIEHVAKELQVPVGEYTHFITVSKVSGDIYIYTLVGRQISGWFGQIPFISHDDSFVVVSGWYASVLERLLRS